MKTCTRKLEFDSAHRVLRHESKCIHLHGHRYVLEVTCGAEHLDSVGRVIDFGVIKQVFGGWIDEHLDHGYIASRDDDIAEHVERHECGKVYYMPPGCNPTAEELVSHLADVADGLLRKHQVHVVAMRLYETPNCWADWIRDEVEEPA